jgi:hypothetical protein
MRKSEPVGSKPRPWSLPRLQRAIGNQALNRLIHPPPPVIEEPEDEEAPFVPSRSWPGWLLPFGALIAGAIVGWLAEMTAAAPYMGPVLGAALGVAVNRLRASQSR